MLRPVHASFLVVAGLLATGIGCGDAETPSADSSPDASPAAEAGAAGDTTSAGHSDSAMVAKPSTESTAVAETPAESDSPRLNPPAQASPAQASTDAPGFDPYGAGGDDEPQLVQDEIWVTDLELAKKQAADEGKDILMNFTGSDWCGYCIELDKNVFRFQEFANYADDNFVLLKLDFPRDPSLVTEEERVQNAELQSKFNIAGYPTILLTDAQGRPYAQTGYQPGGPDSYANHLEQQQEMRRVRDEAIAAAEQAEGIERAKKLDDALQLIPEGLVLPAYDDVVAQIIDLDQNNEAGLKEQYLERQQASRFQQEIAKLQQRVQSADDIDAGLQMLDEIEKQFADYDEGLSQLRMIRFNLLRMGERTEDALVVLESLIKNADDDMTVVQLLVNKADMLKGMGKVEEAKAAFQAARDNANPQLQNALDNIAAQMFPEEQSATSEEAAAPGADSQE